MDCEDSPSPDDIHEIKSLLDLERLNLRLSSPSFLRSLSPSQLPSQAASDGTPTPNQLNFPNISHQGAPLYPQENVSDIQPQLQSFQITHYDTDAPDVFQDLQNNTEVDKASVKAWLLFAMSVDRGYLTFEPGHSDVVLAVDFNFYGTRMVTASSDNRLKVWDRKDDNWSLVDTWKAHDAEIVDVKWNGPFLGEVIGSIGEDGRFRIWQEDVLEVPKSGRRFRQIYNQISETKVPFMSLDFKNVPAETYVALATRDGYLTVLEPVNQDNLTEWQSMHGHYLCHTPPRQEESAFKVCFHRELYPSWASVNDGGDEKTLSLAVAAMDTVKIFRTGKDRRFYQAAELTGARNLVRDIAWANGSHRGFDTLATASKDGCVRIYEIHTEKSRPGSETAVASASLEPPVNENQSNTTRQTLSGIGAGLASSSGQQIYREPKATPGRPKEIVTVVAEINPHSGALWRVAFSQSGDVLISTGDDGVVRSWKRALDRQWLEYAEIDVVDD